MKKAVFGITAFFLSATLAGAGLLLNDAFDYPDGPPLAANLVATGADLTFSTNAADDLKFFRVYRAP